MRIEKPLADAAARHLLNPARIKRATDALDLSLPGIEYGPLSRPIASREIAPRVSYVDYADTATLRVKCAPNPRINVDDIVDVDVVTDGRPIDEFFEPKSQGFIIASHVAEHVPDLIGWLRTNEALLMPGGCLSIIHPDRRFTFDATRPVTLYADLVAAFLERRTRPTLTQIAHQVLETRDIKPSDIWSGGVDPAEAPRKTDDKVGFARLERIASQDIYHDAHCWVFSDEEYVEMLNRILPLHVPRLKVAEFLPTRPGSLEFHVILRATY